MTPATAIAYIRARLGENSTHNGLGLIALAGTLGTLIGSLQAVPELAGMPALQHVWVVGKVLAAIAFTFGATAVARPDSTSTPTSAPAPSVEAAVKRDEAAGA